jgi:mRNA interferase HigB
MRVLGRHLLESFLRIHPEQTSAKIALQTWHGVVKGACWRTPADVKATYRHASILKGGKVVFNISGNSLRMVVAIDYKHSIVRIRWIGPHAKYDAIGAESV